LGFWIPRGGLKSGAWKFWVAGLCTPCGRGQPLSLTVSFGKISWFDVPGEIQRCDWCRRTHSLEIDTGHIHTNTRWSTNHSAVFPPWYIKPRNFAKRQCERQWL